VNGPDYSQYITKKVKKAFNTKLYKLDIVIEIVDFDRAAARAGTYNP
jgi:hypothetical protein